MSQDQPNTQNINNGLQLIPLHKNYIQSMVKDKDVDSAYSTFKRKFVYAALGLTFKIYEQAFTLFKKQQEQQRVNVDIEQIKNYIVQPLSIKAALQIKINWMMAFGFSLFDITRQYQQYKAKQIQKKQFFAYSLIQTVSNFSGVLASILGYIVGNKLGAKLQDDIYKGIGGSFGILIGISAAYLVQKYLIILYEKLIDEKEGEVSIKRYKKALKFFEIDERANLKEIERLRRLFLKMYDTNKCPPDYVQLYMKRQKETEQAFKCIMDYRKQQNIANE